MKGSKALNNGIGKIHHRIPYKVVNKYFKADLLRKRSLFLFLTLIIMFLAALSIRAYLLDYSNYIAERQYRSALIARDFYYGNNDSIPDWRKQISEMSRSRVGSLEPPIFEYLVSMIYRVIGSEQLWIAGFLSSVFWVVGGLFLYKLAERIVSASAAVIAAAYYLFLPLAIRVSIGFLPDPLMTMMFLISLFMIVRYYERPSHRRLIIAATSSGLAVLVKPLVLFVLSGAFISLAIERKSNWRRIIDFDILAFFGIFVLPIIFYYSYGIITTDFLSTQARVSFIPSLLFTQGYWKDTILTASNAVGFTPLIAALFGLPLLRKGLPRTLLIGLWFGYIVFCLVFTYHVRFASHYHTQLIIIIALSFGPIVQLVIEQLSRLSSRWYWYVPVIGALLLVTIVNIREIRKLKGPMDFKDEGIAQEIGTIVGHSGQVIYVAPYYGMPLEYYGELSGKFWPRSISDTDRALDLRNERSIEERLEEIGFVPEYFVITDFREFYRSHEDLDKFLEENCSLLAENEEYMIFESCNLGDLNY